MLACSQGVEYEVDEHLLKLGGIGLYGRQAVRQFSLDAHLVLDKRAHQAVRLSYRR
jgi:hypothetical protein